MADDADRKAAVAILDKLAGKLRSRGARLETLHDYYRGQQALRFVSEEFRQYFSERYSGFSDNWCQVVADSSTERLEVQGIRLAGVDAATEADDDLNRVWAANGMEADSGLGFLSSIIGARSYILVWGNPDDESTPEMSFEDAREAIVSYVPGSRRKRAAGLKLWTDGDQECATLYLPDFVWKFQRRRVNVTEYQNSARLILPPGYGGGNQWQPRQPDTDDVWPLPNPFGCVPMVELPNRPMLGGEPLSDIDGVVAMQDAINLLWSHLFTASDFAALPQRVVMGAETPTMPILDSNGQVVGEKPIDMSEIRKRRIVWLTDPDAKIGEWSSADLAAYTGVIELQVGHVAAQTRTPQHYLVGKMANLSADALKAAEAGLVKKTMEKQLYLGEGVREAQRLVRVAQGASSKAIAAVAAGSVLWKDAEMRSEAQLADAILKMRSIGFPFEWCAERYGLGPAEVSRLLQMRQDEQSSALLAGFLPAGQTPAPTAPAAPAETATATPAP